MPPACPEDDRSRLNGGQPPADGCPLREEWDDFKGGLLAELAEVRRETEERLSSVAVEVRGAVQETLGHFSETIANYSRETTRRESMQTERIERIELAHEKDRVEILNTLRALGDQAKIQPVQTTTTITSRETSGRSIAPSTRDKVGTATWAGVAMAVVYVFGEVLRYFMHLGIPK